MTVTQSIDSSREIACTRVYKVSKDVLIRMWSNPEHITNWWGPSGFSTTTHAMDFKTDGIWQFTMHGPDGVDYPNLVKYVNVSPSQIAYCHYAHDEVVISVVVDFNEVAEGTEMDFRMTFPTAEIRRQIENHNNAEEGMLSTVKRLGEYAALQDPTAIELAIVRQFDANQERVWKAITEPEQLKQWLGPRGLNIELKSDELAVGGKWALVMSSNSGFRHEGEGEFLEIDPIELLKMTHRWKNSDGTYKPTTTVTYNLHEHDGKTTLTFVQSGFWSEEAKFAHLGGWSSCVHNLTVLVEGAKAHHIVELEREFDAPIDLVWKCWTEPKRMAAWFAPLPYTCPKCEIDFRAGGSIYLVMRSPDGHEHAMSSTIVDIEPLSSIGWVNSVPDGNGDLAIQGGTFVNFTDLGGRTKVTVYSYNAAFTEAGTYMVGGMEQGWNMTIDQMVAYALSQK